jgi:hypothetical protein
VVGVLQALRDPLRVFTDFATKPASYIIFTDGSRYYAKNGLTGIVEYSDTDASNLLQKLINALSSVGGRIFIKSGTYILSSTVTISNTRQLVIEGELGTVLKPVSSIVMFHVKTGASFPGYPVTPVVEFRNIVFDGDGKTATAILVTDGSWQTNIVLCVFRRFQDFAVKYSKAYSHRVLNCIFTGNYGGLYIGDNANDIRVDHSIFEPNSYADVMIKAPAEGITISDCWMEAPSPPTKGHIYIYTVSGQRIVNINIRSIRFYMGLDILVEGDGRTDDVNVTGCYFHGPQAISSTVSLTNWKIIGNSFFEAYQYGINANMANSVIAGNFFLVRDNWYGIYGNMWQVVIADNVFMNYESTSNSTAIHIINGDLITITGNVFAYVVNAIYYGGYAGKRIVAMQNTFYGVPTPVSGSIIFKLNGGYITEGSGVATISAGTTRVTVSHGLAKAPSKVLVTPLAQPPGKLWVENITSTSFDIVTDVAPTTNLQVAWYAEV